MPGTAGCLSLGGAAWGQGICDTLGGGRSWHPPTHSAGCSGEQGPTLAVSGCWEIQGARRYCAQLLRHCAGNRLGAARLCRGAVTGPDPKVLSLVTAPLKLEHLRRGAGHWASAMVGLWLCWGISLCAGGVGTLEPTVASHP